MNIILFSRPQSDRPAGELRSLLETVARFDPHYAVNEEFAPVVGQLTGEPLPPSRVYARKLENPGRQAIMVSYGGDGTLLEAVHRLDGEPLPVLGINAGHLGFLTCAPNEGFESLFRQIAQGGFVAEPRALISVTGDFAREPESQLALNEFTIQRHGAGLIVVETCVDGLHVATYHGDGVIVATPTGSTAYSLSAGGPVVAPACRCLTITPLAPHNLTMRPVVIPDESVITLRVRVRHSEAFATLDNRTYPIECPAQFTISRAEKRAILAVPHNISFYDTLRNKMMWGVDARS